MNEFDDVVTPDDILKVVTQRTGLSELESDSWKTGLAIILDEVNTEGVFTAYGRHRLLDDVTNALGRRLAVHDYVGRHPEVLETPVERPLFVLGMPARVRP